MNKWNSFQTEGILIANPAFTAQVSEQLVLFFMSAEAVVLNIHASWKAEVLIQHCSTREKYILTYLHVQIFYT